jgi:ribosomal protein L7/L12
MSEARRSKHQELIEALSRLTASETFELLGDIEERWGVSASPAYFTPSAAAYGAAPFPEEESSVCQVTLSSIEEGRRLQVMKAIREHIHIPLGELLEKVSTIPSLLLADATESKATELVEAIRHAGGVASVATTE